MIDPIFGRTADELSARRSHHLGAFGEKLRKQREQRGIELDAISNTTKISTRMLRALEEERFDQLPGGVFNKGFVRAYARHVGLDEQEAIADYLAALNGSQVPPQENLPAPRTPATNRADSAIATAKIPAQVRPPDRPPEVRPREDRPNEDRPNKDRPPKPRAPKLSAPSEPLATPVERFPKKYPAAALADDTSQHSTPIPWEKLAVALLLVALVLAFWSYRRHRQQIAAAHPTVAIPQSQAPSAVAAPDHTPSVEQPAGKSSAGTNAATSQSTNPMSATTSTPTPPPSSTSTKSTAPNSADDDADSRLETSASKNAAHAAALKPAPTFTLVIRANETSWISITADGSPVATETLIAPAGTSVRATHEIVVKTGNAAGLSFALKGKTIPTEGNEGEVKTFTFDSTGLRDSLPAQTPTTNP
jgi:cytoskeletal protein RodZ